VRLSVFNMLGEEVGLLANQQMESGIHTVEFDASNLSTGIYFYKLTAADFQQTRKMLLVK
ncbi:MAG: T9SS type A sorting domain-containing protein, partial [Melioribacteraceae bacterium]|nr:T9SS type A sorting domain-containing protein [Melioribacteraceae bacterium]MCF8413596.1 T9SS type A sorting domain-containing protein [Melioribacteraceae bacterium]